MDSLACHAFLSELPKCAHRADITEAVGPQLQHSFASGR